MTVAEAIQEGLAHHRAGRLLEAETIYRQILAQDARNADALHLLGLIAHQAGKHDDAAQLIGSAIAINPTNPDFHNNLGEVRRAQNRLDEAEQCFRRSVARNGNAALINNNLGLIRQMQGRWGEALEHHKMAATIQPGLPGTYIYAAQALRSLGRVDDAFAALEHARQLEPNNPGTLSQMGTMALENNRAALAVDLLVGSLRLRPTDAATALNLGYALNVLGRNDEAIDIALQLTAANPQWLGAHHLLAMSYADKGEDQKAYETGLIALGMDRENPDLLMMMSSIAHQVGKDEESLGYSKRLLELRPEVGAAHWNRAIVLLGLGQFEEGWKEFEWRLKSEPQAHLRRPDLKAPLWPVDADVTGKTVLLYCEGGFGDALQFIRYLPMVREKGAEVLVECQRELRDLFSRVEGIKGLFTRGEELPEYDYQCPLQGLPLRCGTRLETIPASIPYLSADPDLISAWKDRLSNLPSDELKIGLVWAGSPNSRDRRSRALATLTPLGKVEGVHFVSLQRGKEEEEAKNPPEGMKVAEFTEQLTDFAQAAALVENLDLLITVDTAAAHLAGALGKEVWVMLPACPDFRWMLEREDSPWYPSMRLFRKSMSESWDDVAVRVGAKLAEWVDAKRGGKA